MEEDSVTNGAAPPPGRYFNRDLSWIDFNGRVLEEGLKGDLPPLERLKFLSIVSSNFDEFFMVRAAALSRALRSGTAAQDPSGLEPGAQLKAVSEKARSIIRRQYDCLRNALLPALASGGLKLIRPADYSPSQMAYLESYFMREVFPVLTPLRVEGETGLPSIGSFTINCAFLLRPANSPEKEERIAVSQIPRMLSRIIVLPDEARPFEQKAEEQGLTYWALLEDMVLTWGRALFPGFEICESMIFRLNRDADFSVDEQRDEDFIEAMEEVLEGRESSAAVRMVYNPGSRRLRDELACRLSLKEDELYEIDGPVGLEGLMELANVQGTDSLREKPWAIHPSPAFNEDESIWDRITQGDVMLHLPYQSFDPVIRFFQDAAADPQVIAIKVALYRTSGSSAGGAASISPIVRALEQASLAGKHVTAMVELKARFDEQRNISWANRLEKAGVIVIYGLARLKVHAKIALVIRRENDRIKRYVHLSTGNYNDRTAKFYEDIGLFTCREEIAFDAGTIFNMITGYSDVQSMRKLVIAPTLLKRRLMELIDRETKRSSQDYPGRIMAKINSLADTDIIKALYRASRAGVKIRLCVRGICVLVPGVPGLSENITVVSIIDHYLEHSRIFYFSNGGADELYLSSADWMPRNLERRVELMFPVQEESIKAELLGVLNGYFRDNTQARLLDSLGNWTQAGLSGGEAPFRIQKELLRQAARAAGNSLSVRQEFIVRRSPPGGDHEADHP